MKFILLFFLCLHVYGSDEDACCQSALKELCLRLDAVRQLPPLEQALQCSCWRLNQANFKNPWRKRVSDHLQTQAISQMENIKELKGFADPLLTILLEYQTEKHPDISYSRVKEQAINMLSPRFHLSPEIFMQALCFSEERYLLDISDIRNQGNPDAVNAKYVQAYKNLLLSCLNFCDGNKVAISYYQTWHRLIVPTEKD
ncbi:MAG: hypothetical protein OXC30_00720 [Alphaproteobacteria bacterium]|nr:hypothetical protein [Alphaproteobacteria bacterium]